MNGAFLIALVFAGSSSVVAAEPVAGDTPEFAALSVEWEGFSTLLQRVGCNISGGGRSDQPVRATFDVAADGAFKARFIWGRSRDPGRQVAGVFRADSSVKATHVEQSICHGEKREQTVALSGKLSTKQGRHRLELSGENPSCRELKCVFERRYQLTHR